jgi:hypothetical protein
MEVATNNVSGYTKSRFAFLRSGLYCSALMVNTGCSDRTHFIPPNKADPILQVSEIALQSTDDLLAKMTDAGSRNAVQFQLLAQSDIYCGDFISSIYSRRAVTNVWYSSITTATAAAAAIVGGRAAQNLAGTSAVTNEMRGAINNEMYGGEIIPTVAKEIGSTRKVELREILNRHTQPLTTYSSTAALSDVIRYHELCSIPIAISSILARANAKSAETTSDLTSSLKIVDDAIAIEKAKLTDKINAPDAAEVVRIKNRIGELSDRRTDLVRMYVIPGVPIQAPEVSKPAATIQVLPVGG